MLVTIVSAIAVGSIPVYDVLRILLGKIPGLENLFSFTYPLSWETIILFRNPMADPFVIGISSGAALGAVIALALEKVFTINATYVGPFFAFAGALGAVLLVYSISRVGRYEICPRGDTCVGWRSSGGFSFCSYLSSSL